MSGRFQSFQKTKLFTKSGVLGGFYLRCMAMHERWRIFFLDVTGDEEKRRVVFLLLRFLAGADGADALFMTFFSFSDTLLLFLRFACCIMALLVWRFRKTLFLFSFRAAMAGAVAETDGLDVSVNDWRET